MNKEAKLPKILIIEDDKIAQRVLLSHIEELNCEIDQALTGTEAEVLCSNKQYDLILLDMELPDRHGSKVTEYIRHLEWGDKVMIIANSVDPDNELKSLTTGASSFCPKPISKETLCDIVRNAFPKHCSSDKEV